MYSAVNRKISAGTSDISWETKNISLAYEHDSRLDPPIAVVQPADGQLAMCKH